jgi:hypothetical protein
MWTMSLKVNIPLMPECWIQFFFPPDFDFKQNEVIASGMFLRKSL